MDHDRRSSEERLYAERAEHLAAEVRRLSLATAEAAERVAAVERGVWETHEMLATSYPSEPRYADKAEHARRNAENAESFAAVERKVAAASDPSDARAMFEPYRPPPAQKTQ